MSSGTICLLSPHKSPDTLLAAKVIRHHPQRVIDTHLILVNWVDG
jgi:hypothetical protein